MRTIINSLFSAAPLAAFFGRPADRAKRDSARRTDLPSANPSTERRSFFDRRRTTDESQRILHAVAEHANDGLVYQDMEGRIIWANQAYCRIMGYELHEIVGRRPQEYCFPPELTPPKDEIDRFVYDPDSSEFKNLTCRLNIRRNGERFWQEFSLSVIETARGEQRVIVVTRDVTKMVEHQKELECARADLHHAAHHDALTDLPNRAAFQTAVADLLGQAGHGKTVGLLYLDLDKFKSLNDIHGHPAGDAALIHVADAMRKSMRPGDIACRIGGDEFLIATAESRDFTELEHFADALIDRIQIPLLWRMSELKVTASVGLSLKTGPSETAEDLIRMADFALLEAKSPGGPRIVRYDAGLHRRRQRERSLVEEFVDVLDDEKLEFVYQPLFNAEEGRMHGFETLARWRRADGTVIGPDQFLAYAARLNRMADIDFAAIRATASLVSEFQKRGRQIRGSFNVSPETLAHSDFLPRLDGELHLHGLTPEALTVEVLETTFFGPDAAGTPAATRISELRAIGMRVVLDDFGVGYAGLAHLGQLDVSGIKIDRSLVANVVGDQSARIIATSILQLCHELGVDACAEGIETVEQANLMVSHGCYSLQGYGIARPMSRADLIIRLTRPDHVALPRRQRQNAAMEAS
ncbi:MAG: bifunctional diguanylate cyclase/phosphodiesterase [Pseudomonadota bacterium]